MGETLMAVGERIRNKLVRFSNIASKTFAESNGASQKVAE
jgi:hypothetical protein